MIRVLRWLVVLMIAVGFASPAWAHVGSKDVYETVDAGPYKLFVTVRMPNVIPGVATIEARVSGPQASSIRITPVPLTGEASKHPPTADGMKVSAADPQFFTGSLWLMASGSWQVRFEVEGAAGAASAGVPVAATPISILPMQRSMGIVLGVLGLILLIGVAGIVAAAVREARLTPGATPSPSRKRRAMIASVAALVFAALMVFLGNKWWNVEAASYASRIYRPLEMQAMLTGNKLDLTLGSYDAKKQRWRGEENDTLLPDHGHLMHLYAIREPEMDAVFHLHPQLVSDKRLEMTLPAMPAGTYKLYGDIVHANGFPETMVTTLTVPPNMSSASLGPEDACATPPPISQGMLGTTYKLGDGYSMVWDRPDKIEANTAYKFRFTLIGPDGKPATDMQPYLGMSGHAAFVKYDGMVFAHTHPDGSASMPAMMIANGGMMPGMPDMPDRQIDLPTELHTSPVVEFPYGFPTAGNYRIFIQMKHGGTVETGVFDVKVL
jgi:hypothetical protein